MIETVSRVLKVVESGIVTFQAQRGFKIFNLFTLWNTPRHSTFYHIERAIEEAQNMMPEKNYTKVVWPTDKEEFNEQKQ